MELNQKQLDVKGKIEYIATLFGVDPSWATAVAMTESSLGMNQKSPTGCSGVFQMSLIAMKDLLQLMQASDDDLVDIACGISFLKLLLKRWKTIDEATNHFCDPADRSFYLSRVKKYMESING